MGDKITDRSKKFVFRLNDHGQGPELLRQVFLERGWVEFDEDTQTEEDWNLWWRTSRFRDSDYEILQAYQQLNHYPRSTTITKKDSLARNLKRMRGIYGPSVYNFSPIAFNLPNDYTKFVAEYTRLKEQNANLCWICKPADMSRGRGIFIFRDLSDLQYDCNAVVQKYLTNPMLISGYKFDLRIYVMVPSFRPLNIYIYQEGLVRFGTEKFNMNNLGNLFSHLTNTSINKYSPSYTAEKERVGAGCKWTITQLRHYFHQVNIDDEMLWRNIVNIVLLTLILQANQVPKATNCFELYGFDIMVDDKCKAWLIEVNFSPALSSDCQTDIMVKKPLLHDLLDYLNFQKKDQLRGNTTKSSSNQEQRSLTRSNSRLPSIVNVNSKTLLSSYQKVFAEDIEEEEFEIDNSDIVPLIPGCGLPSVQHPPPQQPWQSELDNSPRCSTAWSGKSADSGEHRPSSPVPHRTIKKGNSNIYNKSFQSPTPPHGPKEHRESKVSIQSDSGLSSYSSSSDTSDLHLNPEESQATNSAGLPKRSLITDGKKSVSNRQESKNGRYVSLGNIKATIQRSAHSTLTTSKSLTTMSSTALMSRYALTDHIPDVLKATSANYNEASTLGKPTLSRSRYSLTEPVQDAVKSMGSRLTESAPLLASKVTFPRSTRASTLRTSVEDGKKKTGQFGYTANRLSKSVQFNRRKPANHTFNSSKLHNSQHKPLTKVPHNPPSNQSSKWHPQKKIGDFYLVYPFNDVTRKCSAGIQDVKVVIREAQKLLKEFEMTNQPKAPLFDLCMLWEGYKTGS